MSVPKSLQVSGGATLGSCSPCCAPFPSGSCTWSLNFSQTVQASAEKSLTINSPVTWVDLMIGTGITSLSAVLARVRNPSSFELRFTTASGTDQVLRLSELFLYSSPVSGQNITALAARGSGDLELMLAGT